MVEIKDLQGLGERLTVDTSEEQLVYLLAGKNGSYIRLSPSAYHLLQLRSEGLSFEDIAQKFGWQTEKKMSPGEVESAYQQIVERIEKIEKNTRRPQPGFLIRFSLLPEKIVVKVASLFSIAFHPVVASCLLVFMIVSIALFFRQHARLDLSPQNFWLGYALLFASTLMHEFGHASACARYGAQPSDIGFTLYLIYPTFYSDVSSAWRLRRWQRVVVDLGGAFFQLVVGAGYAVAYMLFGQEPFRVALLMILGNLVFSLNPIFRFDGYWIIADALGVTNLGQQPIRIVRHLFDLLRGRPTQPLPWPTLVKVVLLPYTLLSFGIWGFFVWRLGPMAWRLIYVYPTLVSTLVHDLLGPSRTVSATLLQSLLMSTFMIVMLLLMVWRLGSPLFLTARSMIMKLSRKVDQEHRTSVTANG